MGDTAARGRPGAGDDSAAEGAPAAEAELRTQDAPPPGSVRGACALRTPAPQAAKAGGPLSRPLSGQSPRPALRVRRPSRGGAEVAQGSRGAPRAKRRAALSVLHINGGNTWDAPVQ